MRRSPKGEYPLWANGARLSIVILSVAKDLRAAGAGLVAAGLVVAGAFVAI